jgi:hypothetical protein
LFCFASPVSAIVVTSLSYSGAVNGADPVIDGLDLSGVVDLLINGNIGCSGSLLSDGLSILTAGHCITSSYGSALPTSATVSFLGPSGTVSDTVSAYFVDPSWNGNSTQGGDLAVLRLTNEAPAFAARYSLYTGAPAAGPELMAGYGAGGTGLDGAYTGFGTLRAGTNEYVAAGSLFGWSSNLLVGQFYDAGIPDTNSLGVAYPYTSFDEVDIAHGDSGGPSFYGGELIGVHDLGMCFGSSQCNTPPSVNGANNSYFGEMYADTSVSGNAAWIEAQEAPEPALSSLLGLGLAVLAALRFRSSSSLKPGR